MSVLTFNLLKFVPLDEENLSVMSSFRLEKNSYFSKRKFYFVPSIFAYSAYGCYVIDIDNVKKSTKG